MTKDQVGYVIWGALAIVVLIPELLAALGRERIPWPGVARTATNLSARIPWLALVFLAGFVILGVHIIFYPLALARMRRPSLGSLRRDARRGRESTGMG